MITRFVTTLVIIATMALASSSSASILIDNYEVGSTIAQFTAGTASQTTNNPNILGGSRDATLTVPNLGGSEFFGVMGFGGALQLAQGLNDEINGSLVYDGFTAIDLTEAGVNEKFLLQIDATNSIVALTNAFSITVGSGAFSSTVDFDIPASGGAPDWAIINFSDFSGVDLTSVDSITLGFDLEDFPGTNLTINSFFVSDAVAVPEPVSLTFLAGLAWFLVRRRQPRG